MPRALPIAAACVLAGTALAAWRAGFCRQRRPEKQPPPPAQSPQKREIAMAPPPLQLTVLTLNAWGLLWVAQRREERVAALADFLRSPECTADIITFQELWVQADVGLLRQAGTDGQLPHSFHWQSGAIGSGLVVLSRYPIVEVAFHPYAARGDPAALLNGDFLAGKGVGWVAVQTPAGTLSVFNTHLSANYGQEWQVGAHGVPQDCRLPRDSLAGVRLLQMCELAAFVRARTAASASVGTVLAGDLNSAPDTLEMMVLQALLPELKDAWAVARPLLLGATANALESSFTTAGGGHRPIRIDYILTTGQPLSAELALTDTGRGYSYSDHLGVEATLRFGASCSNGSSDGSSNSGTCQCAHYGSTSAGTCSSAGSGGGGKGRAAGGGQLPALLTSRLRSQLELMRRQPDPFYEAAAIIERAADAMGRGRQRFVRLAAGLLAAGLGCWGALLARPWWHDRPTHAFVLLLGGMGVALGGAGVLFVGGFVARGIEFRALRQAALQLRVVVGATPKTVC